MTKKKIRNAIAPEETTLIRGMEEAGLAHNEAIVYLYLLKAGQERGASKIALATGIHRQYVYVTLEKLIDSGLAIPVKEGARSKYKATPPGAIERLARKKFDSASETAQRLSTISALGNEQDFEIFFGDKQVRDYEFGFTSNLKEGETQYLISGASQNFLAYFGSDYEYLASLGKQKKFVTYYIGGSHEAEQLAYVQKLNPHFQYRILDGMPNGVTSTVVRNDCLVLYSMAKPPLVYVIHSKIISAEYKAYFDMMWNMAKSR